LKRVLGLSIKSLKFLFKIKITFKLNIIFMDTHFEQCRNKELIGCIVVAIVKVAFPIPKGYTVSDIGTCFLLDSV
jgi:hypothetical protein